MPESADLLDEVWDRYRGLINARLEQYLALGSDCPPLLSDAMAYSLTAGGKRLRPVLVLLACEACGGDIHEALPAACAIEMIHTYSLIHDDLPAMDDDDVRRGRPTNHVEFGEAHAILAGDGLLTYAFEILARDITPGEVAAACCVDLARAAGPCGMVGGQAADLEGERWFGGKPRSLGRREESMKPSKRIQEDVGGIASPAEGRVSSTFDEVMKGQGESAGAGQLEHFATDPAPTLSLLEGIHLRKTGRLLACALTLGARIAKNKEASDLLASLDRYGRCVGLAFQIADDLLDVGGDQQKMGKGVRKDAEHGKLTYPGLIGVGASREKARMLIDEACRSIAPLGERGRRLDALAHFVLQRDH